MNYRRQAWIVTGVLSFGVILWAVWAYHDAYVAEYRANKQANAAGSCPFKAGAASPGGCCQGAVQKGKSRVASAQEGAEEEDWSPEAIEALIGKYGKLSDFTEEQLKKCPHYESLKKHLKRK
jgi:hypothetical protein